MVSNCLETVVHKYFVAGLELRDNFVDCSRVEVAHCAVGMEPGHIIPGIEYQRNITLNIFQKSP